MLADGNNERPTVDESYAGAVNGSSLRVGNDANVRTPGDLIAAAGMNQYRMGMALMRLMSEWQSGATPPNTAKVPSTKELARQAAVARVNSGITASEEEYGGMRVSAKRERRAVAPVTKQETEHAEAEARLLAARSTDWHVHENKLRFQRLKTLPAVRAALLHWAREKGWEEPEQLVADTLRHFLAPVCSACEGRKRAIMPGTSRAVGKECRKCRATGEADLQHGGRGRALLGHIRQCVGQASSDLREGAARQRRSDKSEADRLNQRLHRRITELQRADAEAQADATADNAAVAEHFRKSMETRRT